MSDRNCFFAAATAARFSYFDEVDAIDQWRAREFDQGSVVVDPQLDANLQPTAAACATYGHTNRP